TGSGVTLSNLGFHAPPQHPGWGADGTAGNAGFSSAAWVPTQTGSSVSWSSETIALNSNANALRWGTLYNFRFDSNRPPQAVSATIGFFKTGAPITVQIQGPSPAVASNATVSGRVTTQSGQGIGNIYVYLIDSQNVLRASISSPFGYYSFANVLTGQTYSIVASSKRYDFPPPTMITVNGNVTNPDIVALP
ncbi:MAG: carboxypeptidase-like regulatory domain-containing protein, partial [Pyrinomonadaceae bacterium]